MLIGRNNTRPADIWKGGALLQLLSGWLTPKTSHGTNTLYAEEMPTSLKHDLGLLDGRLTPRRAKAGRTSIPASRWRCLP
jgi:hypothetical protein